MGLQLRCRLRSGDESGFTIVELAVALTVLAVSMLALTATLANALRPLTLSKQRAAATAVAQEALEVARSLAWVDLGLVASDATLPQNGGTDPSIVSNSGVWSFGAGCPSTMPCEPIQYATNSSGHPFNPHIETITRTPSTVTREVFVTGLDTDADGVIDLKRITVRATFDRSPIQGVSRTVRLSTLVSATAFSGGSGAAAAPLVATSDVTNGWASLSAAVGIDEIASPLTFRLDQPLARLESILSIRKQIGCTARSALMDITGGSSFGPAAVSTLADDDPLTATAQTDGPTTTNFAGSGSPADIDAWLVQASVPGAETCLSTVLGPDGVAGGDDDLPYGSGNANSAPSVTLRQNASPAVPALGNIDLFSATTTSTATGTVDEGPADTVVATAIQSSSDTRIMAVTAGALPTPILASYGLVRVEAISVTATATGSRNGTPTAPSVNAPSMRIWIYDPLLLIPPAVCPTRSAFPDPLGYCIVTRSITSAFSYSFDEAIPQLLLPTIRYSVSVVAGTPNTTTTTGTTGTTWTARVSPVSVTVRLCATTAADCATTAGKVLDLQTEMNFGTVMAQVVRGFGL